MAKKEWVSNTLEEKGTASYKWRAQTSTSPTGVDFIGVRKFKIDAEGTETPDRQGITLKIPDTDEGKRKMAQELAAIGSLFAACAGALQAGGGKSAPKAKPLTKKAAKEAADAAAVKNITERDADADDEVDTFFVLRKKGTEDEDSVYVSSVKNGKVLITRTVGHALKLHSQAEVRKMLKAMGTSAARYERISA